MSSHRRVVHSRRVRWYQRPLHEAWVTGRHNRLIEIAHRRWGKDEIALMATCELAHQRIASYWHCLPEYEQGRKALWDAVNPHTGNRRIDEAFPAEIREGKDEQKMMIRLKCGSTWQIVGSDRYDSLVGAGPAGVVFSEWALANPTAWAFIRPMLEENNGWAAFITTPRGRNHAKSMYDMAISNPRWFAELSTVTDTGALTAEQIENSLREYVSLYGEDFGRAQFDQEYMCSFNAAILGAYYSREMLAVRSEGRIADIEPQPGQPVHTAWDIGIRDSTAIWWWQVLGSQIYVLDCHVAHGVGLDHYADLCRSRPWPRGIDYVPHDAMVREWGTGRTRLETMQALGLNPRVVPTASKMDGINAVRRTLPLCVFHPRCEESGIAALELYRRDWDDERKTFKTAEVHDWTSHAADAFRYLAMAWRQPPAAPPPKPAWKPDPRIPLPPPPDPPQPGRIRI